MDVFWFHRTLDVLDPTDSKAVAAVILAFFIATTMLAERRSYRALAVVVDAYESTRHPTRSEDETR